MTVSYRNGEPLWVDVEATDVPAAANFYCQLFGWDAQDLGEEAGHYTFLSLNGAPIGAIAPYQGDSTPDWTVYFKVADARTSAKAIEAAGAKVREAPLDVFDQTTIAEFTDPGGADFAILQPRKHQGSGVWNQVGAVGWVELVGPNVDASLRFYRSIFDWTENDNYKVDNESYTLLTASEGTNPFGGAISMSEADAVRWLIHFEVADCDATVAKATELGARVLLPARTSAGAGRYAVLADKDQAAFGVIAGE